MTEVETKIEELATMVGRLIPGTEAQFLLIGSRLNKIYAQVETISVQASSLVNILDDVTMKTTIDTFRRIIERMEKRIETSGKKFESGISVLKDVRDAISSVAIPLSNFRKIVKRLNMLGISIRIESAQIKQIKSDFKNVSGNIEKLSELIHDKCAAIERHQLSLIALTTNTLSRISDIKDKSKAYNDEALENVSSSISLLETRNRLSFAAADSIVNRFRAISGLVSELVTSMQFHDITRQQVEHIKDALDNLLNRVRNDIYVMSELAGNPPAARSLAETSVVFELQKVQLLDAKDKFVKAVNIIIDNLHGIISNIFKVFDDVSTIAGGTDFVSNTFFSNIESGTGVIIARVEEATKVEKEFLEAMVELSSAVSRISTLVDDIEDIGAEIELIAVNARVSAAHIGDKNSPLGIIAEAIWHLSMDATKQKSVISNLLKKVVLRTEVLQTASISEQQDGDDSHIISDLSHNLESLKSMKNDISGLMVEIDSSSQDLSDFIKNTIDDITVHQDFAREVSCVSDKCDEFIKDTRRGLSSEEYDRARRLSLEYIQDNYTMQRERIIHKRVAADTMSIEGTNRGAVSRPIITAYDVKAEKSDLGENVELF